MGSTVWVEFSRDSIKDLAKGLDDLALREDIKKLSSELRTQNMILLNNALQNSNAQIPDIKKVEEERDSEFAGYDYNISCIDILIMKRADGSKYRMDAYLPRLNERFATKISETANDVKNDFNRQYEKEGKFKIKAVSTCYHRYFDFDIDDLSNLASYLDCRWDDGFFCDRHVICYDFKDVTIKDKVDNVIQIKGDPYYIEDANRTELLHKAGMPAGMYIVKD